MSFNKAFRIKLKRALARLWYWDIWHLRPGQPLSWRYFLPGQSEAIQLHRHLWWHSRYKLPGLLWLPLEFVRWLHWGMWAAKRQTATATELYGAEVESRFGISIADQVQRIGYWAKAWCINPYTAYDWQLYRQERDALAIIYENETSAYHALRNRKTGANKADHRLLGDKIALAEKLSALGVPMVETARISSGDWQHLLEALQRHPKVFCKLRSGNQGESAFAVWHDAQGICGLAHDGKVLADESAVLQAWSALADKGEFLIQPYLLNHPDLAPASQSDEAIIVRLVSTSDRQGIMPLWAELQVPSLTCKGESRGFWRLPISVEETTVLALDRQWLLAQRWQAEYDALWQNISKVTAVPYWHELHSHSLKAHAQLPNVWAIAWDWVLTPDGPVLLEGNSGWGLDDAQRQGVNLLAFSEFKCAQ